MSCTCVATFRVRIEMIGRPGSTAAMAWRTCALDRLAPGRDGEELPSRPVDRQTTGDARCFKMCGNYRFLRRSSKVSRICCFAFSLALFSPLTSVCRNFLSTSFAASLDPTVDLQCLSTIEASGGLGNLALTFTTNGHGNRAMYSFARVWLR